MIQWTRKFRRRETLLDALFVLLIALLAVRITWPWVLHPRATMLAWPYGALGNIDALMNMTFGGWMKFSLVELKTWPLAHTPYLMYPYGASHGVSFDSLMFGVAVGFFYCFLPLVTAYSLAVLLCFVFSGLACYGYAVWLWGRGLSATLVGLMGGCVPFLLQRFGCHPNLIYLWTIPLAMFLFDRYGERPGWRRWAAWVATFPLLAASSWYFLIVGIVHHACASAVLAGGYLRGGARRNLGQLLKLALGWVAGFMLVAVVALPMFEGLPYRKLIPIELIAKFSTPLLQYLIPYPGSYLARLPWVRHYQAHLGTDWEAFAGVPILLLALALIFPFLRRVRLGRRLTLTLSALAGLILSLGPYLQIGHVLPAGTGLKLPLYYLCALSRVFTVLKNPGRVHILVFFATLFASGHVLEALRAKLAGRGPARRALWPALAVGFVAINYAWSVPPGPFPVSPAPTVPRFYAELGRQKGAGAIFDVPIDYYLFPHYNYYQFWHKRPVVTSTLFHDAVLPESTKFIWTRYPLLFFLTVNAPFANKEIVDSVRAPSFMKLLADHGIEFVVVHPRLLRYAVEQKLGDPRTIADYEIIEKSWSARRVYQDEEIRVYRTAK